MPIKPTPIQLVRSRFNEITRWRATGVRWLEICDEMQSDDVVVSANTLRILYQRELKRRKSPRYDAAIRWALANQATIADLLARGFTWVSITRLVPVVPGPDGAIPTLEMLVMEFESINHSQAVSVPPVTEPELITPRAPEKPPEAMPLPNQNHSELPSEPPTRVLDPVPPGQPSAAQSAADTSDGPFTGKLKGLNAEIMQDLANKKVEEEKARVKRELRANRKSVFAVKEDPYESVAEIKAEYDRWRKIHRERVKLYDDTDESDADLKSERERARDESDDMISGYQKLLRSRRSHDLTTRSKLCVLSTAALACGVYTITDTDAPDAITLCGFDRPDSIEGMDAVEIPDPVIIRPNLTQDEIDRLEAARSADATASPQSDDTASPKRRIAEALVLRGVFEWRWKGWVRYDEIVVLEGTDLPSPSLCGYPASRSEITIAPPSRPDDPNKDDYPSVHRQELAQKQLKGVWL